MLIVSSSECLIDISVELCF